MLFEFIAAVKQARDQRRHVFLCGNGGSAANALHIANDLVACGVFAVALTGNIATLTAIANDYGYAEVFARQLNVYADAGDLLIVLTGSGNSPNVLRAVEVANQKHLRTWAISGGGEVYHVAQRTILTSNNMQESEEKQLYIGHQLCVALKD